MMQWFCVMQALSSDTQDVSFWDLQGLDFDYCTITLSWFGHCLDLVWPLGCHNLVLVLALFQTQLGHTPSLVDRNQRKMPLFLVIRFPEQALSGDSLTAPWYDEKQAKDSRFNNLAARVCCVVRLYSKLSVAITTGLQQSPIHCLMNS